MTLSLEKFKDTNDSLTINYKLLKVDIVYIINKGNVCLEPLDDFPCFILKIFLFITSQYRLNNSLQIVSFISYQ